MSNWKNEAHSNQLTFSIVTVGQASAASLVPSCIPHALDEALSATGAAVLVGTFLSLSIVIGGGNFERLNSAARQANRQERLRRVQCLSE